MTARGVTLAGTARLLPDHSAFAFGLTYLALVLGGWPVFVRWVAGQRTATSTMLRTSPIKEGR